MGTDESRAPAPGIPTLIYDAECTFCVRWVARWKVVAHHHVAFVPLQEATGPLASIPVAELRAAVHLVIPSGKIFRGAEAVFRLLTLPPKPSVAARLGRALYDGSPGFARLAEAAYRFVATHRTLASRLTSLAMGGDLRPSSYVLTRWLFLRLIGLAAFAAFLSLAPQIDGLIGSGGIVPAASFLAELRAAAVAHGVGTFELSRGVPTLAWLSASDFALHALAYGGAFASLLVIADIAPFWALLASWLAYLSLASVGGPFLEYQWDALLLEASFVGLFLAPYHRVRPSLDALRPPGRAPLWLARFLTFKLMYLSGTVKRLSGDPAWENLTALRFHYETQPLPFWTSYYAARLPAWFHALSAEATFAIEIVLPFFIFVPRRGRVVGFAGIALLQTLIAATGNYGFFNLLTIAIASSLLSDQDLTSFLPRPVRKRLGDLPRMSTRAPPSLRGILAAAVLVLSAERTWAAIHPRSEEPGAFRSIARALAPFSSVNSYGLFAVMTTERREIALEGSLDGETYEPYVFRYKPGDLFSAPRFAWFHLPRLDWQLWFASLSGDCSAVDWYFPFAEKLLQASPPVRALFAHTPFGDRRPRFLRSTIATYRFSTAAERRTTGAFWVKGESEPFCPVLTLEGGDLRGM